MLVYYSLFYWNENWRSLCINLGWYYFEDKIITINHNVYSKSKDEKGKWFIGTPKTINSERKIYICDTLLIALNNYKKKQENLRKLYGKKYHYYHIEEVKNKHGKVIEYRICWNK